MINPIIKTINSANKSEDFYSNSITIGIKYNKGTFNQTFHVVKPIESENCRFTVEALGGGRDPLIIIETTYSFGYGLFNGVPGERNYEPYCENGWSTSNGELIPPKDYLTYDVNGLT